MKVAIFIDGSTLYYGLRRRKFDFSKFRDWLINDDEFAVGKYFNSLNDVDTKKSFLGHVYMSGFKLYIREPLYSPHDDRLILVSSDVELGIEAIDAIGEYDKLIIVSGKHSFLPLCEKLTLKSKIVEIVGFRNSVNKQLNKYPIRFIDDFLQDEDNANEYEK